ncbi:MAG: ABC transporter substrate-binding protein [Deltaproteobacteria bacterium]|nr:ABC transporter substrate-binding protein [Deltaproteobacteria bacterium]
MRAMMRGVAFLAVLGLWAGVSAGPTRAAEAVTFALDWAILGRHAGYFASLENGYYSAEGLNVTLLRGYGSGDTIKRVAAGRGEFGFADIGALIIGRIREDIRVKSIGVMYSKAPHSIFVFTKSGIKGPKDLEGKAVGSTAGSSVRMMFAGFAKTAGVNLDRIRWVYVDPVSLFPLFLAERVDAMTEFNLAAPLIEKQAAAKGLKVQVIPYADHGLSFYSNALLARDDYLRQKPAVARGFVKATMRGWQFAFDRPDEAIEILRKAHREVDPVVGKAEVQIVKELALTPEARQYGLGYVDRAKMASSIDLIVDAFDLKKRIAPEEVYTNDFISR